jgi:predicted Zn-dependent peptidase
MKKLEYNGLKRELYYEKLDNGLEIFVFPMKDRSSTFGTFTTKYGSNHNNFRIKGEDKYNIVPHGIAHFLEHKLFESADGIDPFNFYAKSGSSCNANTWYYRTVYLFEGHDNFENNLNYLLDFVQSPYLTDENVLKEKGIITEEAKMYLDFPSERLDIISMNNLFENDYMKYPVIGTLESINSITKEDLMKCYNTFYNPSNMFLTVSGPVDPLEVINIIKENQNKKHFTENNIIEFKEIEETEAVISSYQEYKMDINVCQTKISYKISSDKYKMDKYELINYFRLYLQIKFGLTSYFANKLLDEKKILEPFFVDVNLAKNHLILEIGFESNDYKEVISLVKEEMLNKTFNMEDFNRKKKMLVSVLASSGDNVVSIAYDLIEKYTTLGNIYLDAKDIVDRLNYQELENMLSKETFENNTTTVLKPLKD